ncbi:lysozyme inhibitor LprI family protein [Pseudomonas sp. DSP3-2-2]|uniref:lysozyme inhibitor LprI family protein n=1 Tax=unclassified Pseudomonas TaxID=196821 RepID=UPI003CF9D901
MKTVFLTLALLATGITGAHAATNPDATPCDGVDEDKQTLECSKYSRETAEQLLNENFQNLLQRVQTQFGANKAQFDYFTGKLKTAQQAWQKLRDADCAVEVFPAAAGSKAFTIAENDCLARMSDERSEYLESIAQE